MEGQPIGPIMVVLWDASKGGVVHWAPINALVNKTPYVYLTRMAEEKKAWQLAVKVWLTSGSERALKPVTGQLMRRVHKREEYRSRASTRVTLPRKAKQGINLGTPASSSSSSNGSITTVDFSPRTQIAMLKGQMQDLEAEHKK